MQSGKTTLQIDRVDFTPRVEYINLIQGCDSNGIKLNVWRVPDTICRNSLSYTYKYYSKVNVIFLITETFQDPLFNINCELDTEKVNTQIV